MSPSPFARHHYDQGYAASKDGDVQAVEEHIKAIAQHGTPEDVQDLIQQLSDAARNR